MALTNIAEAAREDPLALSVNTGLAVLAGLAPTRLYTKILAPLE